MVLWVSLRIFAWGNSLDNFRLGTIAWELASRQSLEEPSLGNFRLGIFGWDLSLGALLGTFCLGPLKWDLRLGELGPIWLEELVAGLGPWETCCNCLPVRERI